MTDESNSVIRNSQITDLMAELADMRERNAFLISATRDAQDHAMLYGKALTEAVAQIDALAEEVKALRFQLFGGEKA